MIICRNNEINHDSENSCKILNFVTSHEGGFPINRILVANNGIAAVKEIRSIRKWCYDEFGDDKAIKFIVMASLDDIKSNSEFIRISDQIIEIDGGSNNNNYANVDLIVDLAIKYKVQVQIIIDFVIL
jgi:acetyl-CoA carboxylase/biotin carboxylase 1